MNGVPQLRIGDAERDSAATALGEHYAAGRLTKEEFDERAERAWSARFHTDLEPLFADLPSPGGPLVTARDLQARPAGGAWRAPQARPDMRGWHPHPLMRIAPVVAVMFVAAVIISGAPWLLFMLFWFWAFAGAGPRRARARWRQQQMVGPAGSWRPARRQDWAS